MDKFVTVWFTVMFTLCIAAGVQITEAWTAYIVVGMMIAIFPMVHVHDWIERFVRRMHERSHARQRAASLRFGGIYPYDDWK